MISQVYPNNYGNGAKRYPALVPYVSTNNHVGVQQYPSTQLSQAAIRAAKLNITTAEWQRRDEIVRKLAGECKLNFMDTFFPPTLEDYIEYGLCVYLGKPSSYSEIDADEWPKSDHPLIFNAQSLNENGEKTNFCCNLAFMKKVAPTQ